MSKSDKRAVCPECGDRMVKVYHQNEEGDWSCGWECTNCQPTPEKIAELNAAHHQVGMDGSDISVPGPRLLSQEETADFSDYMNRRGKYSREAQLNACRGQEGCQ